jgi:hypothetical protein
MVANALVMKGETKRETDMRGQPLNNAEEKEHV